MSCERSAQSRGYGEWLPYVITRKGRSVSSLTTAQGGFGTVEEADEGTVKLLESVSPVSPCTLKPRSPEARLGAQLGEDVAVATVICVFGST